MTPWRIGVQSLEEAQPSLVEVDCAAAAWGIVCMHIQVFEAGPAKPRTRNDVLGF
eukprot:gene55027-17402_t